MVDRRRRARVPALVGTLGAVAVTVTLFIPLPRNG
jgi:hypothetical protein